MNKRLVLDLRSSSGILSSNPTQMRILERIGIFQTVAKDTVEAGVPEQNHPCEHQPGDGE